MKFRDWVIEMNRIVRSLRPIEGSNIVIERTPKGSVFHAKAGTGGEGSSGYEGPFSVMLESRDGAWYAVARGYNADEGRLWRSVAILGSMRSLTYARVYELEDGTELAVAQIEGDPEDGYSVLCVEIDADPDLNESTGLVNDPGNPKPLGTLKLVHGRLYSANTTQYTPRVSLNRIPIVAMSFTPDGTPTLTQLQYGCIVAGTIW
jgi:hypothetical protein